MLEKGTITLTTSGYVPSASHMALCKHVGQTRVSKNLVCLTRGERHYRMLNNCCWHSGRGGFHSQCKTLCFPGSTAGSSGRHFLLPGKNLGGFCHSRDPDLWTAGKSHLPTSTARGELPSLPFLSLLLNSQPGVLISSLR